MVQTPKSLEFELVRGMYHAKPIHPTNLIAHRNISYV